MYNHAPSGRRAEERPEAAEAGESAEAVAVKVRRKPET